MRKKKPVPEPRGPLSEEEMNDWARYLSIKRAIEGPTMSLTTVSASREERAWAELRQYQKLPRLFVKIQKDGTASGMTDRGGEVTAGTFPMSELGFKIAPGRTYIILCADITPPEGEKKCVYTLPRNSRTRRTSRKPTRPSSRKKAGASRTTGRRRTQTA